MERCPWLAITARAPGRGDGCRTNTIMSLAGREGLPKYKIQIVLPALH